jgi:hypothetical protein
MAGNFSFVSGVDFRPKTTGGQMANGLDRRNNGLLLGVVIGAAVVALAVLAYFYYQRSREPVVKIDVPGFQGEIRKDNGGVDIEVGKPNP